MTEHYLNNMKVKQYKTALKVSFYLFQHVYQ